MNAPGYTGEAKMVNSHSEKRPFLVTPKGKGAGLMCDYDCPQYKSAKHTVAAAAYSNSLESFINSYVNVKKTLSWQLQVCQKCEDVGERRLLLRGPSIPLQSWSIHEMTLFHQCRWECQAPILLCYFTCCHTDGPFKAGVSNILVTTSPFCGHANVPSSTASHSRIYQQLR